MSHELETYFSNCIVKTGPLIWTASFTTSNRPQETMRFEKDDNLKICHKKKRTLATVTSANLWLDPIFLLILASNKGSGLQAYKKVKVGQGAQGPKAKAKRP